jgi:hypothetical protein
MKFFYSAYPLEQAAFDQVVTVQERIQQKLEEMPANTLITEIAGHVYWLGGGRLFASPSVGEDGSAPSEDDINDAFTIHDIDGIGVYELSDIVSDSLKWLSNPKFISIPEDAQLISEQRQQMEAQYPETEPYSKEPRHDLAKGVALEPTVEPSTTLALRYSRDFSCPAIIAIDGEELDEWYAYDDHMNGKLREAGYQVMCITMTVPHIDVLGVPSAFKPGHLASSNLAVHLLKGLKLRPFFKTDFGEAVATTLVREGDDYSITVALKVPASEKDAILAPPTR